VSSKVAVVGAGSWGSAVAALAVRNVPTTLWARRPEVAAEINDERTNASYLPGFALPRKLKATASLEEALDGADVLVMGVPSHGFREVLAEARGFIGTGVPIISLTKGVEQDTLKRMTEVIAEVAPDHPAGVLTGPNLAKEIMAGFPAASVVAMSDEDLACELQDVFRRPAFRVYTNPDVVGCEVAGALKNVMAIAVGMADGMGFGENTKATLITRGLHELTRLGVALGGQALTFLGLAGIGDLVATCASPQSRNRHVGEQLGRGRKIDEIIAEMKMVAEGVKTSKAVVELGRRAGVDLPIMQEVVSVLYEGKNAADIVPSLMQRAAGPELEGLI
jgi:glycerol-3-phosphate dehydrogenase (NAD(P)+)